MCRNRFSPPLHTPPSSAARISYTREIAQLRCCTWPGHRALLAPRTGRAGIRVIRRRVKIRSATTPEPHHGSAIRRPQRTVTMEEEAVEFAANNRGEITLERERKSGLLTQRIATKFNGIATARDRLRQSLIHLFSCGS